MVAWLVVMALPLALWAGLLGLWWEPTRLPEVLSDELPVGQVIVQLQQVRLVGYTSQALRV